MGDSNYKRTTGYKNWMGRRCWFPVIENGVAFLIGGSKYAIRNDGWRKVTLVKKGVLGNKQQA